MQIDLAVYDLVKKFGQFTAVDRVSFDVEKGRFFSILGPSGCGKTTMLRMIAGFTEPTAGRIEIGGKDIAGMLPNKRPVNLIFQNLALFPMMNVAENIAFGLKRRRERKAVIQRKVGEILERVSLPGFEDKEIDQLSGGQKQRVAIARSLVLEPTVLLLDEPLGALDLKLREQMKVELKTLQNNVGTTFVYITHDQSEALVMSDHVAVMNKGRFEQIDTPTGLYSNPRTPFVARFVGDNNQWKATVADIQPPRALLETDENLEFKVLISRDISIGSRVDLFIRPEALVIQPDKSMTEMNRFDVRVKAILFDGANSMMLAKAAGSDREFRIALPQTHQFDAIKPGDVLETGWNYASGTYFPTPGNNP
jgi:spermidine/putrescine transport system ATP-binding protein